MNDLVILSIGNSEFKLGLSELTHQIWNSQNRSRRFNKKHWNKMYNEQKYDIMIGAANSTMNNNAQLTGYIKYFMHYGQSDLRIQWEMISIYQEKSTSLENRSESSIQETESVDARALLCCQSCADHQRILSTIVYLHCTGVANKGDGVY